MIGDNEYDRCDEVLSQVGYEQIYSLDTPPLHCYIVKNPGPGGSSRKNFKIETPRTDDMK